MADDITIKNLSTALERETLLKNIQQQKGTTLSDLLSTDNTTTANSDTDKVDVSLARAIKATLDDITTDREEKVAKIKEMVATGKYQVSSEDVAKSFIERVNEEVMKAKELSLFNIGEDDKEITNLFDLD